MSASQCHVAEYLSTSPGSIMYPLDDFQFEVQLFKWLVLIGSCSSGISIFHNCISECFFCC